MEKIIHFNIYFFLIAQITFAAQLNSKNDLVKLDKKNSIDTFELNDSQMLELLKKKSSSHSRKPQPLEINLNDCHLGESVFNSFAQVKIDQMKKRIIYKEFDQEKSEIINLPDLTCSIGSKDQSSCYSETKRIYITFFNTTDLNSEKNQNLMSQLRNALGREKIYANKVSGIIERPVYDPDLKKFNRRTDSIHCVQQRY